MEDREIILCYTCKGKGFTVKETLTDFHRREYDYENVKCRDCDGSGRLIKTITTKIKAYKQEEYDEI